MRRRTLVLSAAAASAGLLVGWSLLAPRSRLGRGELLPLEGGEVVLNGWIRIAPRGEVLLAMPRSEMGQGVHTALAMLVAEELDIGLEQVRLVAAAADAIYGNVAMFVGQLPFHPRDREPGSELAMVRAGAWFAAKLARELGINVTGGSSSMADAWEPLRLAAATARAQLVGAASLRWKQPKHEITLRHGVLRHASGQQARFGELAESAAATPPGEVSVKPRADWQLIGSSAPRTDLAAKSSGSAVFGMDVRPAGLVFAAVRMCPKLGGAPQRVVNENAVLARPGVLRLVRLAAAAGSTAGVAVVARSNWHAQQAVMALQIEWAAAPAAWAESRAIETALAEQARAALASGAGRVFHRRGDLAQAAREAGVGARTVEAHYRTPYLAHAGLEPTHCTARVAAGRVTVWAPTQVPGIARAVAARAAGVEESAVEVHVMPIGGSFGRRLECEVVAQAVTVAGEMGGLPVQLLWSREEDMTHDFYRPAAAAAMQALLGADGLPRSLQFASAGDAVTPRWTERGLPHLARFDVPDKSAAEGLFDLPYDVPHQRIAHLATQHGVPVGYWRSVGHSHNAFFTESFIDELAHAAGRDPLAYRQSLLGGMPRHAAVLRLAAEKAGWGTRLESGHAHGLALHESFGSIVAQVAEVSLLPSPRGPWPRVHRVVCAIDCGTVVNPGLVAQQMEGGIAFGLTAALYGRIDIVRGEVRQKNYPDQPLLGLAEMPQVDTHIVASQNRPSGVGEPGTPPIAPAVANALFVLTGRRLRELPLRL